MNTLKLNTSMIPKNMVGFDEMLDGLLEFGDGFKKSAMAANPFPPYNIVKVSDTEYQIEVAVAGFSREDLAIDLEDGVLTIKSIDSDQKDDTEYLYQGIAKRKFERVFRLAEEIEVKGAEMVDGMLTINMERIVPESKKPQSIKIS